MLSCNKIGRGAPCPLCSLGALESCSRLKIPMSMKTQTMGEGNMVDKMLVPVKNPLGKQVSSAKWWSTILNLPIQHEPNHDIRQTFFSLFFLTSTFLTFRLALYYISSVFLNHKICNWYRNGSRNQSELFIQPLKKGCLEAFSCMAFYTVEDVPLAPFNQLSPCLNTPAHVFAGDCVSQISDFSLDSMICPHISWRMREATGNPPVESLPVLSRWEGCLYKHSI